MTSKIRIIVGDSRKILATLPSEFVHCIVTSPPYFGLRDYGCVGQIGLESTPESYIAELVALFREARRVLRSDGTFWLNLGDSYAGSGQGAQGSSGQRADRRKPFRPGNPDKNGGNSNRDGATRLTGVSPKQRLMIPARVALALQADGWWLRDEIIWHKPNPMPVSVTDRTTPAHEMLYMFSRSAHYFYDMEAVREPSLSNLQERRRPNGLSAEDQGKRNGGTNLTANCGVKELRQPRSVWTITPKPFKGAHFATFPPDLIRPCILAGSPIGGTILDPFFGAGTTGLVASQLGRNAIGIELNREYARLAADRIQDLPRRLALLAAARRLAA